MKRTYRLALWLLSSLTWTLTAVGQQPVITDFNPKVGTTGDSVTISGSGFFGGQLTVRFWNNKIATIFVNSDSIITAFVPSGVTTGAISVQKDSGTQLFSTDDFLSIGSGPYISGLSPNFGAVNDSISILGVHFSSATPVKFNGVNAPAFNINAAGTQINVFVPSGAKTGPVSVTTLAGTSNSPTAFTVIGPGPYVTGFSPVVGNVGTSVAITGRFLTGTTAVKFNNVNAISVSTTSDTLITATVPGNISTGPITVITPVGTNSTATNFFAPPTVDSISPAFGRAGTNVTITGRSLLGTTKVTFGMTSTTNFTIVNNTNIHATVPQGATTGSIRVTAPAGSTFSTNNFKVQPTVYGFSPMFGNVGSSVVVTGANFNVGTPVVRFNGVQAAAPTGVSFGQLTAVVPNGATTGPVSVSTSDGSHTNGNNFFLPATIASFSPTNTAPGTRISIKGQNFIGATAVKFGGLAGDFNVTNNTSIGATVPTNAVTGPVAVTTPAGTVTSAGLFYGAPIITNFTPTHGLPGDTVTIKGVSFLGATAVRFNGLGATITSLNNTQAVAKVPSGAQTGPISVEAPGGTNASTAPFVLDYTSDLQISVTDAPNPVIIGSNLVYTISIVNKGPFAAPNVLLTNTLPSSVKLISASATGGWTLVTNSNPIEASIASMSVGSSATFVFGVIPETAGNITNVTTISSGYSDPSTANNIVSVVTTVQPLPVLSISASTNEIHISWPLALSNYVLESRIFLNPGFSWSSVTTAPVIVDDFNSVTETNSGGGKFYRLKH